MKCLKLCSEIHIEADNTELQFENVCFKYHVNLLASFQFIDTFSNRILFGWQGLRAEDLLENIFQLSNIIFPPRNAVEIQNAL